MLLNLWVLSYEDDETWALQQFAKLRWLYCFGDWKTIKNTSAFENKLSNCSILFEESSLQAEIFLEAFDNVIFLPGDWHTGMNMLQSLYKLFLTDLLKPLRDILGWKRIAVDVRACYYQASWFVKYTNNVVSSYLIRAFLLRHYESYEDRMKDDNPGDLLCSIAVELQLFLSRLLQLTDEHLKLMVNFLFVSVEFLEFVLVYKSQDSITIEKGYQWFAPIWKILGQVKYLEVTWEQMDAHYGNFPYSRLQEIRMNRQVQTYPGFMGKSALAQDEWVELNNKEFSNMPSVRTLDGMSCQGNYICMTQWCKHFLEKVYSAGAISERAVYCSGNGAKGYRQLKRKLLWEAIDLLLGDCILPLNNKQVSFICKLELGSIPALEEQLTKRWDRSCLDKESRINCDDDSASSLFNGVHCINNCIKIAKSCKQEVDGNSLQDCANTKGEFRWWKYELKWLFSTD